MTGSFSRHFLSAGSPRKEQRRGLLVETPRFVLPRGPDEMIYFPMKLSQMTDNEAAALYTAILRGVQIVTRNRQ